MKPFFLLLLCASRLFSQTEAPHAMVVSARIEASRIGADILRQGGNAFDAMIATHLALAVAYPYAGNISGGGFLVYRLADGSSGTLDFREMAPMAATRDMFLNADGSVNVMKSTQSALAVGVPGSVAALFEVHRRFGSLPIKKLFEPAIALAEKGVIVTAHDLEHLKSSSKALKEVNDANSLFFRGYRLGDTIRYNALANTLERILKNGPDEFYRGRTARKLVRWLQKRKGIISKEDLANYKVVWRDPVRFRYRDYEIVSMPLPSSGGFCLQQILGMIEPFDIKSLQPDTTGYIRLLTEAERRSYADRNEFLGDPEFIEKTVSQYLDPDYLKNRMKSFSWTRATPSAEIAPGESNASESNETTHYSIVDPFGNAVSVTTTLNGAFGSKLYCDDLGFFLNNEMDDFSAKPGTPNSYGLTGSEANAIAPGKRMLSSMTPTIVEKDGKLFMVLGSPGGSTIITSVLQVFLNVAEFGMTMQQAVDQPRFHHQWLPDKLYLEPGRFPKPILEDLKAGGYHTDESLAPVIGKVDAIRVLPDGSPEAGADHRGDDAASGF